MGPFNDEGIKSVGQCLLKIKEGIDSVIRDVYLVTTEDGQIVFAIDSCKSSPWHIRSFSKNAYELWNSNIDAGRRPNSVFCEDRTTRVLLDILSIERAQGQNPIFRFALYYWGKIYWLNDIAENKLSRIKNVREIKRFVNAPS